MRTGDEDLRRGKSDMGIWGSEWGVICGIWEINGVILG